MLASSQNRWAVAFAIPGTILASLFVLIAWLFGARWWSVPIGILSSSVIGAVLFTQAERITVRSMRATPTNDSMHPRLENLLENLCAMAGVSEPTVYMVSSDKADAAVFGTSETSANLAVTHSLLNTLSVVELEGVLARELARIRSEDLPWDTRAVSMIRLPLFPFGSFGRELVQWARGTDMSVQDDLAAVELTRYPPGLAQALQAMEASPDDGKVPRITSHLWVIGNSTTNMDQAGAWSIDNRIEVLKELT